LIRVKPGSANATSTSETPTTTSITKWFAVAMTENAIAIGIVTANARMAQWRVAWKTTMPTARFQPAWKLGIAAY
jgi:hypothetical protein